jgi:NAD(P)H-dependent FMN reductase
VTAEGLKLKIVLGSTRPKRAADLVVPWVMERAESHGSFEVELLDLREWPLPFFNEHISNVGDLSDPTYSDPVVKRWNSTFLAADAVLVITPEYLHSVPGVLKNAFDSIYLSFALRNKPMAGISYSIGIAAIRSCCRTWATHSTRTTAREIPWPTSPFRSSSTISRGGLHSSPRAAQRVSCHLRASERWRPSMPGPAARR